MSKLSDIAPRERLRVMDLVREAGIDVSDWQNFKGGVEKAASNPKYCYEWSFEDLNKKLIVLNLWHENIQDRDGSIVHPLNLRKLAESMERVPGAGVRRKRAIKMDFAIQKAVRESLPVQVIVCEGHITKAVESKEMARRAEIRLLDPEPWAVTHYNSETGECVLTRGTDRHHYSDQFDLQQDPASPPERRAFSGQAFVRSAEVRKRVLTRAAGHCEWCNELGFRMSDGSIFVETHHIIPLAEGGNDIENNVVALCPNHHRKAHYGSDRAAMRQKLMGRFGENNAERLAPSDHSTAARFRVSRASR